MIRVARSYSAAKRPKLSSAPTGLAYSIAHQIELHVFGRTAFFDSHSSKYFETISNETYSGFNIMSAKFEHFMSFLMQFLGIEFRSSRVILE